MKTERRKSLRIQAKWPIILSRGVETIEGETLNLSAEGISFTSEDPVRFKGTYQIVLRPPDHPEIALSGDVIWSDLYGIDEGSDTYCMGICLLEIREQDAEFIVDTVRSYLA